MSSEFNLISEVRDNSLVIKTEGYINNTGGEKILQEFSKHKNNISNVITNLDPTIEKTFNIMGLFQFAQKTDSIDSALK